MSSNPLITPMPSSLATNQTITIGSNVNLGFSPINTQTHQIMTSSSSPTTTILGGIVRKCLGKNKQAECLQLADHANTRWECNFSTDSKDEFTKHCKNIYKRIKWRQLVDDIKPDQNNHYRCVYYSTDKHHVENHFNKAASEANSPSRKKFNNNYYDNPTGKRQKGVSDEYDEVYETPDPKKIHYATDNNNTHTSEIDYYNRDTFHFPDTTKTEDILVEIKKKLQIPQEMYNESLQKLLNNACSIIGPLRSLPQEAWRRLDLPVGIEEELKRYVFLLKPTYSQLSHSTSTTSASSNLASISTQVARSNSEILSPNGRIGIATHHGSNTPGDSGSSPHSPSSNGATTKSNVGTSNQTVGTGPSVPATGIGQTIGQSGTPGANTQMYVGVANYPPWVPPNTSGSHHTPSALASNQNTPYYSFSYASYQTPYTYDDIEHGSHQTTNANPPNEIIHEENKETKSAHPQHEEHEIQDNIENQIDPNAGIRPKQDS